MQYTEDLVFACDLINMKMQAGARESVYKDLQRLIRHVGEIEDRAFWRPTIMGALRRLPEVTEAIRWLGETARYRYDPEYMSWVDLLTEDEED